MVIENKEDESMDSMESVEWNVDMEVQLFYAMRGHKPVGVNRHFQMACIFEKFRNSSQKDVTSQQIWDHLESMYDMAALHESEIVPFPNDEVEFVLPDSDFGNLLKREVKKEEEKPSKVIEASNDEKDNSTPTGKQLTRERLKEVRETDSAESAPKRKRQTRLGNTEQSSKPSSPAASSASNTPASKRRRN